MTMDISGWTIFGMSVCAGAGFAIGFVPTTVLLLWGLNIKVKREII